jgi:hypothetical protein
MKRFKAQQVCLVFIMLILSIFLIVGCSKSGDMPVPNNPDITPLTVTAVTPTTTTGVALNSAVTATFSEAMDPTSITAATFTLKQEATAVTGTVSYFGVTATFTPTSNFVPSTTYTATITTGAKDVAGNALTTGYGWSFTTLARDYTAWSDQGIVYTAPTGDAYYPCVLYEKNGFEDVNTKYKMWYTDGTGAAFLVTSPDGLSWNTPTTMSGIINAHHVQVLYDANHFGLGSSGPKYVIYYWDITQLYSISAIATAQSIDGINWTNNLAISQDATAQLVTGAGTGWNRGSYGPVFLFYQPSAVNSGDDPWSYSYVMYYDGTTGAIEQIGLAYSTDGLFWKAYDSNPVLPVSTSPAWDSNYTTFGTVYRDALGFHFWYSGGVIASSEGIGYAFSTDGKTWTKNPNYIFNISDAVSYRNARVYTPSIIDDGTGVLKMYYSAKATVGPKKIGWATLSP